MTEKSLLADALQLSLGRCREEAATFTEAQSASTSRIGGTGGESYDCSTKASYYLRRSESTYTEKGLGELENELQIPVLGRTLWQSLTSCRPGSFGEVQPDNNQSTDHVKLYGQYGGIGVIRELLSFEFFLVPFLHPSTGRSQSVACESATRKANVLMRYVRVVTVFSASPCLSRNGPYMYVCICVCMDVNTVLHLLIRGNPHLSFLTL